MKCLHLPRETLRACLQCPVTVLCTCLACQPCPALPLRRPLFFPCPVPALTRAIWNMMESGNQNDEMGPRLPCFYPFNPCTLFPCRISISVLSSIITVTGPRFLHFADRWRAIPSLALDRSPRHRTTTKSSIGRQAARHGPFENFTAEGFVAWTSVKPPRRTKVQPVQTTTTGFSGS